MTLSVLLDWAATGERPRRDVVVAFVADEETDGAYGAQWLVEAHPELFAGVAVGIGESGGVVESHRRGRRRARAAGPDRGRRARHPAPAAHRDRRAPAMRRRPVEGSAVLALVDALHRIGHHDWPLHVSPLVRAQLEQTAAALGRKADLTTDDGVLRTIAELGDAADVAMFTVRASTTPTVVRAGYKVNVIPGLAEAEIDVRCPPGFEDELLATLPELVGDGVVVRALGAGAVGAGADRRPVVRRDGGVDPRRRSRLPSWCRAASAAARTPRRSACSASPATASRRRRPTPRAADGRAYTVSMSGCRSRRFSAVERSSRTSSLPCDPWTFRRCSQTSSGRCASAMRRRPRSWRRSIPSWCCARRASASCSC